MIVPTSSEDSIHVSVHGVGPGVVAVPSGQSTAADLAAFADALGVRFRVHTMDRRGRGASSARAAEPSVDTELDDLAAVMAHVGARLVFGHGDGGLIALEAARAGLTVDKVAAWEPSPAANEPAGRRTGSILSLLGRSAAAVDAPDLEWISAYAELDIPVLVMSGGRSPRQVQQTADHLTATIPHATSARFRRLDQFGPLRGAPRAVAAATLEFFAGT